MGLIIGLPSARCKVFQIIQPSPLGLRQCRMCVPPLKGRVAQIRTEEKAAVLSEERSKIPATPEDSSIAAAEDRRAPGFGRHALKRWAILGLSLQDWLEFHSLAERLHARLSPTNESFIDRSLDVLCRN